MGGIWGSYYDIIFYLLKENYWVAGPGPRIVGWYVGAVYPIYSRALQLNDMLRSPSFRR